jgi:WD40 repeat protein
MWLQRIGGGVGFLAYSPDGRTLYTLDHGAHLSAWDLATRTGRRLSYLKWPKFPVPQAIHALADGQRLVGVGSSVVVVWNAADGEELCRVERPNWRHFGDSAPVTPDGRAYFATSWPPYEIRGWNLTTKKAEPARTVLDGTHEIRHLALAPNQQLVAVVCNDLTARLFDWNETPQLRAPIALGDARRARFAPDGRTLAIWSSGSPHITLWDVASRQSRADPVPCWTAGAPFAFNPVLPVFAAIGAEGSLALFSTETGRPIRTLDFCLGQSVQSICFSPDGLTCAVGGSNKQFAVFDVDL